jgi:hypothetical protein
VTSGDGAGTGSFFGPPGEAERLVVVPAGDAAGVLAELAATLAPPYALVYVLTQSNTLRPEGRWQSADPLDAAELRAFLARFGPFLATDGRHGLAVVSAAEPAAVTIDRRGVLEVHGPVERARPLLAARGLVEAMPPEPAGHAVDPARDGDEAALLASRRWTWFPLEPGDLPPEP